MDLSKVTDVKELKALAYDQLAAVELANHNLKAIQTRLAELSQEPKAPAKEK